MATVKGGVTGRPSGKLAGLVFGAARSRTGKLVTAREKVPPSNPDTPAQQTQRTKFSDCLNIVRQIGPGIYQDDWNRAIGQLPGFQSLMSILLNAMDSSFELSAPPTTPLGSLHFPDTYGQDSGGASGAILLAWSTEHGDNGTDADKFVGIAIPVAEEDRGPGTVIVNVNEYTRSAGGADFSTGQAATEFILAGYFIGQGSAEGLITPAPWIKIETPA